MQFTKTLTLICIILNCICANVQAAEKITPKDPKYCAILQQIKAGMNIADVFLIMGPPHNFGQPPNLNMNAISSPSPNTQIMQPQSTVSENNEAARERIKASMAQDPILGAFINAPANYNNVLIWNFEDNTLSIAVKVTGPTVSDVNANFKC